MFPSSPQQKANRSAIAWALISQSIWVPVFIIDTQDQLASNTNDYDFTSTAKLPFQDLASINRASSVTSISNHPVPLLSAGDNSRYSSGIVLNAAEPGATQIFSMKSASSARPIAFATVAAPPSLHSLEISPLIHSNSTQHHNVASLVSTKGQRSSNFLSQLYSRADLLGGTLTLEDLNEAEMPPMARAERAKMIRSGDPLAPIPQIWRESMRKALQSLTSVSNSGRGTYRQPPSAELKIDTAVIVHVPSKKLKRATNVPLALQSDGSVDILNKPDDPAVVEEIKTWSASQQLPSKGSMTPAVVHLHPISTEADPPPSLEQSTSGLNRPIGAVGSATPSLPTERTSSTPLPTQASVQPSTTQTFTDVGNNPPPQSQSVDVSNIPIVNTPESKP